MTANLVGLHDVQQFARTGPEQLGGGPCPQDAQTIDHNRQRIDAGVGDPSGKDRDDRRSGGVERSRDTADLFGGHHGGDIERDTLRRELLDEVAGEFTARIGHSEA